MIKLDDRFSIERDKWCWNLHEEVMGKDKDGNDKPQTLTTYHANISQALEVVIDRRLGDANSIAGLLSEINNLRAEMRRLTIKEVA